MRQISYEEAKAVGGADCGDLTMSFGLTGVSVSGSLSDWGDCFNQLSDKLVGFAAHYSTGIPYGEAHVG